MNERIDVKIIPCLIICMLVLTFSYSQTTENVHWKAKWISYTYKRTHPNTWIAFKKSKFLSKIPEHAIAKIAVDSKYWLWINEKMVVFEGGLKRGPTPYDTYYDTIDIAPYLNRGENSIAIMLWYFGKNGFSHNSSGKAGLIFDCETSEFEILTDKFWQCTKLLSYKTARKPIPNYRLSEPSILYDARLELSNWQLNTLDYSKKMRFSKELGEAGSLPWGNLVLRPIPLWKESGLKSYIQQRFSGSLVADTIICTLPYNAQITPYIECESPAGKQIEICTDNYVFFNGGATNIRAEYITKKGYQQYESLGWLNGHKVYYIVPKGVKILDLRYRESGYNTDLSGTFTSSDPFLNEVWKRGQRTLYLSMRDTYMDCPDRERAQWAGDAVLASEQAIYSLSTTSNALTRKWLYELINWRRNNDILYAPVPAGVWIREMADQSIASIGYFGLWNYYQYTGDKQTISQLYDIAKLYLNEWNQQTNGLISIRSGDWEWGDWGNNKDMLLLYNVWYYLGIKGLRNIAYELGRKDEVIAYDKKMREFGDSFNRQFWNGDSYKNPLYNGKTDDRAQALIVVAGLASPKQYPNLLKILKEEFHASPYMEKYVLESMFIMGYPDEAIKRMKLRYASMIECSDFSTLFEGWDIGKEESGGGTVNHAWSGGPVTLLSKYLCGVSPIEPGFKTFQILPMPGNVAEASTRVCTVAGTITSQFINRKDGFTLKVSVPLNTSATIGIPTFGFKTIKINGITCWIGGKYIPCEFFIPLLDCDSFTKFKVQAGNWIVQAVK